MGRLSGKTAIITGAGQGLQLAALALRDDGHCRGDSFFHGVLLFPIVSGVFFPLAVDPDAAFVDAFLKEILHGAAGAAGGGAGTGTGAG